MNASDGPTSWPRAAQLLFAFFLGAVSSATAVRIHSSQPRPLELKSTRSTADVPMLAVSVEASGSATNPVEVPVAKSASESWPAESVWVRTTAEVHDVPTGKVKTPPLTLLNVNRATREELMQLPGVGPKLAARIVEERERAPFRRVDDLIRVSGIGPKTLARLRPYVQAGDDE